jgi:DNA topoisomerase-1
MNLVKSQQARQVLDLLVGFKISPILWKHISRNNKNALSAGRCQTPALQLIYDNQQIIDNCDYKYVYNTTGYFTSKNIPFELNKQFEEEDYLTNFLDSVTTFEHFLECSSITKSIKTPPVPFTTSKIQQIASNTLNMSPKDTMKLCQQLYEGGYITYMRTDSKNYSKEFLSQAKTFIINNYSEKHLHNNIYSLSEAKNKNAQEAHEAIRPTNINLRSIENLTGKIEKLYKLIWTNTVESCMSNATYNCISGIIKSFNDYKFVHKAEQIVFPGWQDVTKKYSKENDIIYNYFNSNLSNKSIKYNKIYSKISIKNQILHYTEARLVQLLEEKGIGRPSTFASLVEKIQERGYVKKENVSGKEIICNEYELENDELFAIEIKKIFGNENSKLIIQPIGKLVIEFLINHFDNVFNYNFTQSMEISLDNICNGKDSYYNVCNKCDILLDELIKNLNKEEKDEFKIDDKHTLIIARYGPVIKHVNGENISFKPITTKITIDDIKKGNLSIEEIIEKESTNKPIGVYKDKEIFIKKGKFGYYAKWGDKNQSLTNINCENIDNIILDDIITLLENNNLLRQIDMNCSIRKGQKGEYIYYKTKNMKKPSFYNIKNFGQDYMNCPIADLKAWIKYKYNLSF